MGGFYSPYGTPTGPIQGQDPLAPLDWLGRKIVPYSPEEAAIVRTTGQLPNAQPTGTPTPSGGGGLSLASALAEEPLTIKGGIAGPPEPVGSFLKELGTQTYTDPNVGSLSVDRSRGLRGEDWLRSQSNLQAAALDPSGVAADPFAGRNHSEGVLFSGTGTQADLEGRAQARQMMDAASTIPDYEAKLRNLKLMQAQRQAEDPYGLQAYAAREEIRKGTPSPRDELAQQKFAQQQMQQQRDAQRIAKIEAAGRASGLTPEQIDESVNNYLMHEAKKRAFLTGKYSDFARMANPFGG